SRNLSGAMAPNSFPLRPCPFFLLFQSSVVACSFLFYFRRSLCRAFPAALSRGRRFSAVSGLLTTEAAARPRDGVQASGIDRILADLAKSVFVLVHSRQ